MTSRTLPIERGNVLALPAPKPQGKPKKLKLSAPLQRLCEMLTYKRPDDSDTEWEFIFKHITPIAAQYSPEIDNEGNVWVKIGDSPIMWSSHTDTVHWDGGRQELDHVGGNLVGVVAKSDTYGKTNALGADDTAGVWLMTEMIRAAVPGLYVFHRGEEGGGRGSRYAAANERHRLDGIKCAIALDRKGTGDVITHQFGGRCCSDAFAESLANILGGRFEPDPTGMFTDTANYTHVIGECTNLSVGYEDNHGPRETLDLAFIDGLRKTLCEADFSSLVFSRKPGEMDDDDWDSLYGYGWRNWDEGRREYKERRSADDESFEYNGILYEKDADGFWRKSDIKSRKKGAGRCLPLAKQGLYEFVREHPDYIADMLEGDGWDVVTLYEYFDLDPESEDA